MFSVLRLRFLQKSLGIPVPLLFQRGLFNSVIKEDLIDNFAKLGGKAEVTHSFSQLEVSSFAAICGDNNPLHVDPEYAETTMFKGTIVHGILVSSLFSTLFGRSISGSIYVSQDLQFKRPVHVGTAITASIEVIQVDKKSKGILLTCSTKCRLDNGDLAVDGRAKVLVPSLIADELIKLRV